MAINFDTLPTNSPAPKPLEGLYRLDIIEANAKQQKSNPSKTYLALTCDVYDYNGKKCGKLWDNFFDSEHSIPQYKMRRLVEALRLPLQGTMTMEQIAKVVAGKSVLAWLTEDKKSDTPRTTVNVFNELIYQHVSEYASVMGGAAQAEVDARDAYADVPMPTPDNY